MLREFGRYLHDRHRTDCFRRAIADTVRPGDVVVDLGTGFGLLALMCAERGARVYAIEQGPYLPLAAAIAADNGLDGTIRWIPGNSMAVMLPEPADVIVSETIGQFALEEFTVEYLHNARRRFGKPTCTMLPNRLELFVAPASVPSVRDDLANRYRTNGNDETGFDLTRLQQAALYNELDPYVAVGPGEAELLAPPHRIASFDLGADQSSALSTTVELRCDQSGLCDGWLGMFRLSLTERIVLATFPGSPATHWQTTLFPYFPTKKISEGALMQATFSFARGTWYFLPC